MYQHLSFHTIKNWSNSKDSLCKSDKKLGIARRHYNCFLYFYYYYLIDIKFK